MQKVHPEYLLPKRRLSCPQQVPTLNVFLRPKLQRYWHYRVRGRTGYPRVSFPFTGGHGVTVEDTVTPCAAWREVLGGFGPQASWLRALQRGHRGCRRCPSPGDYQVQPRLWRASPSSQGQRSGCKHRDARSCLPDHAHPAGEG